MESSDTVLLERIRAGDASALGEYIQQRRAELLAFVTRRMSPALRGKVEAEDLLQEVSAGAVSSLDNVQLGDRSPFTWLCALAERRIIDAHRHHFAAQKRAAGREVPLAAGNAASQAGLIDLLAASLTTPTAAFSRDQREFQLREAMQELPEEARQALSMRYAQGLPTKEIAEHLGKSDGAVRVLLTRSLRKLQEILGPDAAPR